jgi:hypothetical protein
MALALVNRQRTVSHSRRKFDPARPLFRWSSFSYVAGLGFGRPGRSVLAGETLPGSLLADTQDTPDLAPSVSSTSCVLDSVADSLVDCAGQSGEFAQALEWFG